MFRQIAKLFTFLVILCVLIVGAFAWHTTTIWDTPLEIDEQIYTIQAGSSIRKVSRQLYERKIMPDAYSFVLLGIYEKQATNIKLGDYKLSASITPRQLLDKFVKGDVVTYKISLVEGLTFRQFRQILAKVSDLKKITTNWTDEEIMKALNSQRLHPEGQFYPDTYVYRSSDTDFDVLQQAYSRMQNELEKTWVKRDPDTPLKNKYEALILASIIEKETGQADERPTIGGVFTNRLNKGMLLQTDPTIIYGLGDEFNGNLNKSHLKDGSNPYNTYVHAGLPPTPIAMPGGDSLLAAVAPQRTDFYYFVARGDGSHEFSPTYKAHQRAVNEYQRKRKSKG